MPEAWTYDQLFALVKEFSECDTEQARVITAQGERIAELERQLAADSSNSSRPPSSDAPWDKQPARKRSSRGRSGRKPGRQPGTASASRPLVDDPDETFEVAPDRCARCEQSLDDATETARLRRQVVDVQTPPHRRSPSISWCRGVVAGVGMSATPASPMCPIRLDPGSTPREAATEPVTEPGIAPAETPGAPDPEVALALRPGSPVDRSADHRVGGVLTCGHYLPIGRATWVLEALAGIRVSTGFIAGVRGRAPGRSLIT